MIIVKILILIVVKNLQWAHFLKQALLAFQQYTQLRVTYQVKVALFHDLSKLSLLDNLPGLFRSHSSVMDSLSFDISPQNQTLTGRNLKGTA